MQIDTYKEKYPEEKNLNERTVRAIQLFHEIAEGIHTHGWKVGFLSGFATDAHFGYLTKNHKDVDVFSFEETANEIGKYLADLGHNVYVAEKYKGECLKVDQFSPEKDTSALCDIHYSYEEDGKVVIPLLGKKLVFSVNFSEITEERTLLGEKILVLKPGYLLEEKKGWCEQVGLSQCKEKPEIYQADIDKIKYLIKQ